MMQKPRVLNLVGIVQMLLAASFAVWLLGFPAYGTHFAWPVAPQMSAMFLGTSFLLRTLMGFHVSREAAWYRLRWIVRGNYAFLGVILLATFWHADAMNWRSDILIAHIWVVAYIVEPLVLVLLEPRSPESSAPVAPELSQGPIARGLKLVLATIYLFGFTIGGLLLINPEFATTRWPWPLDPFDARVMAAWPIACAVWAATMYFAHDWVEIRMGVRCLMIYSGALFLLWLLTSPQWDPTRKNATTFGVATALMTAALGFYYWRHEVARRRVPLAAAHAHASDQA